MDSKVWANKVLVTGGAGFIGSHLTERLLAEGHKVLVLDNLSTGRKKNLAHLMEHPNLQFCRADLAEQPITDLIEGVRVVFHLAGLADIVPSIQRPLDYHRANVDATVKLLEASHRVGARRFIYAASSSCYGIPDSFPTSEVAPVRPMYPYALTKYLAEQYVMHWSKVYKLPAISLRLFNVYGPRSRTSGGYGAVFGVFLAQKLAARPLTVVGDGTQTRDFTYVTDVVEAFVRAAESDVESEVFNVGSGRTHSVNCLAELLGGPVVHIPKRPAEPDCTWADTSKIASALSWRPRVSFEDGVQMMVEQIESWREAPVWDQASIADATRDWFAYLKE